MQVESAPSAGLRESPELICARIFRQLKPRSPLPVIRVRFRPYAGLNSSARMVNGQLELRFSDLLEGAPPSVLEALIYILLAKMFRRPVPRRYLNRYRLFLNRRDVQRALEVIHGQRGRKYLSGPQGAHYNLEELFDELNVRFFDGLLIRPLLGWSRRAARSSLGHWDPSHGAIVLSKLLDDGKVPRSVVEYVLFHEMLHLRFPTRTRGGRRHVHTAEFRQAEKSFPQLKEVQLALKRLVQS